MPAQPNATQQAHSPDHHAYALVAGKPANHLEIKQETEPHDHSDALVAHPMVVAPLTHVREGSDP